MKHVKKHSYVFGGIFTWWPFIRIVLTCVPVNISMVHHVASSCCFCSHHRWVENDTEVQVLQVWKEALGPNSPPAVAPHAGARALSIPVRGLFGVQTAFSSARSPPRFSFGDSRLVELSSVQLGSARQSCSHRRQAGTNTMTLSGGFCRTRSFTPHRNAPQEVLRFDGALPSNRQSGSYEVRTACGSGTWSIKVEDFPFLPSQCCFNLRFYLFIHSLVFVFNVSGFVSY